MHRLQHALDYVVAKKLQPETKADPKSFIYMIKCGPFVKIGIAADPRKRLKEMQVGSPYNLKLLKCWPSLNARSEEQNIHTLLWSYHVRGEWFKLPKVMVKKLLGKNA